MGAAWVPSVADPKKKERNKSIFQRRHANSAQSPPPSWSKTSNCDLIDKNSFRASKRLESDLSSSSSFVWTAVVLEKRETTV